MRLADKTDSIGKEEHVLYPSVSLKNIYKGDGHSCLSCTRGHDKQSFAVLAVIVLTDSLNSHLLIGSVCNIVLNGEICNILSSTLLNKQFQVIGSMKSVKSAWRIAKPVNDVGFKAVGVVYDGTNPILTLKTISIELSLMLALNRRYG